MARRYRRRLYTSRRRLRPVEWFGAFTNWVLVPTDTNVFVPITPGTEEFQTKTQPTLMRIRGSYHVSLPGTVPVETIGALGIIAQIPDQVSGEPSQLNPTDDLELPWIWHNSFHLRTDGSTADGDGRGLQVMQIDSSAMRKMYNQEQLYLWIRTSLASVNFAFTVRYLIKE